jgi:hypothetical protein
MMSEKRQCPLCYREHEVAADGTIPTWVVTWTGIGGISQRTSSFIHQADAESEYNWIKHDLQQRMIWHRQKAHLTLLIGERVSWYDLFESPDSYWEA